MTLILTKIVVATMTLILTTTLILTKILVVTRIRTMRFDETAEKAVDLLVKALSAHRAPNDQLKPAQWDLELETADGRHVVVQLKRSTTTRADDLIGRIATGAIELRQTVAVPLIAISMPHVTSAAAETVGAFVRQHHLPVAWALLGDDGTLALEAAQIGRQIRPRPRPPATRAVLEKSPFSDLNCWILKVLLLRTAPEKMWGGPRESVLSTRQLSVAARVSAITANRFVRVMIGADFLRETDEGIVITRRRELIKSWFVWHAQQRLERIPVRWVLGRPSELAHVFRDAPRLRYCVAGFEACALLGALHATYTEREIHFSGNFADVRAIWKLEKCASRDAHFVLLKSSLEESVFRGRIQRDGIWIADPLQTALDVSLHSARGAEQAEYLLHDFLGWRDT